MIIFTTRNASQDYPNYELRAVELPRLIIMHSLNWIRQRLNSGCPPCRSSRRWGFYCVRGGSVSQSVQKQLAEAGIKARYMEGGIEAFKKGRSLDLICLDEQAGISAGDEGIKVIAAELLVNPES